MSAPASPIRAIPPYPQTHSMNSGSPPLSSSVSATSSASESDSQIRPSRSTSRKSRSDRPKIGERQRSTSIIIPKEGDTYQRERPEYPPGDARAMSPRRSSRDVERLERNARQSLKDQARLMQSSLAALAERIDSVKEDHDKLESENKFLQDYIGDLTRTMSRDVGKSKKKK